MLEARSIGWDREESTERIEEDKKRFPLKDISYGSASKLIDLDSLSIYDNKRVLAASLFADVSGFTAYVDEAETEEEQSNVLRVFHAMRKELATAVKCDYEGLRVQYQGDRVQALFHLPEDDEKEIVAEAVEAAVGLQSSMEHTIKECLPEAKELELAVGVDVGTTLVSKLGTRGHRNRICIGVPVEKAAGCEEHCEGKQIGITSRAYKALPEHLSEHFSYSDDARCYVAEGLTMQVLDLAERAADYRSGKSAAIITGAALGGATILGASATKIRNKGKHDARKVRPSPSYCGE